MPLRYSCSSPYRLLQQVVLWMVTIACSTTILGRIAFILPRKP